MEPLVHAGNCPVAAPTLKNGSTFSLDIGYHAVKAAFEPFSRSTRPEILHS